MRFVQRRLVPLLAAGLMALAIPRSAAAPAWQAAYDRAQSAYEANDLGAAEQAARDALAQARAGQGEPRPYVVTSLNMLALVRQRQGHGPEAAELLREAFTTMASVPGAEAHTAALALNLGQTLDTLGRGDEALAAYRHSLRLAGQPQVLSRSPRAQVQALLALRRLHDARGDATEALQINEQLLAVRQALTPAEQAQALLRQAHHLNEQGLSHLQRQEYAAAQDLLERAQAIVVAQNPSSLEVARITANLAQLHEARADDAQAQPLFRQALAIYETHGELPEALLGQAQALNYLAGQDYLRRRMAQAEAQFLQALALTERAAGPQSPRLIPLLDNLVTLYMSQKRLARAAPHAERAEKLRKLP